MTRPLRLFLLILVGLYWFLNGKRRRDRRNRQSEVSEQAVEQQNRSTDNHHQPTNESASNVSSVETTVIQPPADNEQEWRKKQEEFWERQLSIGTVLNWITAVAAIVGIAGMVILYYTLRATERAVDQSIRTFQLDQRAWVGIKSLSFEDK